MTLTNTPHRPTAGTPWLARPTRPAPPQPDDDLDDGWIDEPEPRRRSGKVW